MAWMSPTLQVKYGPYFKPDPAEQGAVVTLVQLALGGGPNAAAPLITRRAAVEKIASVFNIENVDAALEQLDKEAEERAQRELDAATAAIRAQRRAEGAGQNAGGEPAGAPGSGGRAPSGEDDA